MSKQRIIRAFAAAFIVYFVFNLFQNVFVQLKEPNGSEDLTFDTRKTSELKINYAGNDILECLNYKWKMRPTTHPNAPITKMPSKGDELVIHNLTNLTTCKSVTNDTRVLYIQSRIDSPMLRMAIRRTYINLRLYSPGSLKGNWSVFFLVGKPANDSQAETIKKEAAKFGDIVVSNISDEYYFMTTYKFLIGLKVASCYCQNAGYLIKIDDDTFLRLKKIDQVLVDHQIYFDQVLAKSDNKVTRQVFEHEKHARMYGGAFCSSEHGVIRNRTSQWAVTYAEYPFQYFPFYCVGPLNIFSMSSVHELAVDCPHHCIGQYEEDYEINKEGECFIKFDDTHIGSCVTITQRNKTVKFDFSTKAGIYVELIADIFKTPAAKHIAVHNNKSPAQMYATYLFYRNRKLVY
ncbi:uncharacterized protein LOC142351791 [Convolutriloba macropyga]|uniref:uncharacterized protein LOC142351791 n=1 Tax=Convolutriloba macropyga TaxID=536237 RepID=UPI003F51F0AE